MNERRRLSMDKGISVLVHLAWWVAASLIAIAALEWSVPLGFAVTALGGIVLGILIVRGDTP